MYGMVNKAVREMVLSKFSEATWDEVRSRAGAPHTFVAFEQYDDAVTYALVAAASEVLEMDPTTVLRSFGQYWVTHVATKSYGDLMDRTGKSFLSFMKNLDQMHSRVAGTFPGYQPPSFRVKETGEDTIELDYYSQREGLLPFVEGLLTSLATHFSTEIEIRHVPDDEHPMPSKRMVVTYRSI